MDKQQLEAIRARDEVVRKFDDCMPTEPMSIGDYDRRVLLAYVDELLGMREEVLHYQREFHRLREAARKVTQHHFDTCDEEKCTGPCSCGVGDLRRLLSEVKS